MASQAHLDKMKVRQDYRNLWHTDLMSTMGNDPGCTHAAVAICLAVVDVEKVSAQNFVFAPRDSCSASNSWPVYFPLSLVLVECKNFKKLLRYFHVLRMWVYCTVCACMQTQHKIEMDKRDGKFGPQPAMMVPPFQHMSRLDQQVPPSVGYGQQPYGYPPPPQNQGYPPPGYPR
ncbi:PLAC8 family protein [Actinidia rufa]|uniref:PLAC8 family protein n=1 Tax=Actinidia rufa TaxID=165716 RepID=A0A7J0EVH1_9ERIC|nr:PLAC8 family protein [Actinidia rufa]